ncbi:hypothetical protein JGU66_27295 [Myxococcaceae bacterium JPH2]|nr:hypothetical protein [Myxococcaceae bacterium JPH2]
MGTPQLSHTFHRAGDVDWVLGATNINMPMTVEAYNLRNGARLRLDVYAYDDATRTLGALLTSISSRVCADLHQRDSGRLRREGHRHAHRPGGL